LKLVLDTGATTHLIAGGFPAYGSLTGKYSRRSRADALAWQLNRQDPLSLLCASFFCCSQVVFLQRFDAKSAHAVLHVTRAPSRRLELPGNVAISCDKNADLEERRPRRSAQLALPVDHC
jgi:hypothetical protein